MHLFEDLTLLILAVNFLFHFLFLNSESLGSPSKSNTSQQSDPKSTKPGLNRNIMPPPAPIGANKNNSNNSSPKWQANYSGNISPRYVNNFNDSSANNPSSSPKNNSGSNKFEANTLNNKQPVKVPHQQQRIGQSPIGSRPITPIPAQYAPNPNNQSIL